MFEAMEHGELARALRHRREPGAVRGRSDARDAPARRARLPGRAGPVSDRHGADRRRRAAGGGRGVRERRHGHVERAARAARAPDAWRPPASRATIWRSSSTLATRLGHDWGAAGRRARLERAAHAVAGARGHELRAARSARRPAVAVLRRAASGRSVSAQPPVGTAGRRSARAVHAGRTSAAGRHARRRVPVPA